MFQKFDLWKTSIYVIDDFLDDKNVIDELKKEAFIETTIEGQDEYSLTNAQNFLFEKVRQVAITYCAENDIDFDSLALNDIQKGCLYKYDQNMIHNHLYEPHHDMVEQGFVTAIYYVDSAYTDDKWIGGELAIYKHLTFADYPNNTINILPKANRLIVFPGFLHHRVKPYFGDTPRTSLLFGWRVNESTNREPLWI
jgi:hypothetical protein